MGKISEFYSGKSVLVTGATGFCGKLLVEKLLRSCQDIGCVYIIVRAKKNVKSTDRFKEYLDHEIFDRIRRENPAAMHKVSPVCGDITKDKLDLIAAEEQALIDNVNVIFHCAANVRFNDPLKEAININVTGTQRLVELAMKMKKLVAFSYMSTAFSQSYQNELKERHYSTNIDIRKLIQSTQQMDDENLNILEEDLLRLSKHPNTYTLSKAIAEDLLNNVRLPIVIIRPSQVWNSIEEPVEGYIEGLNTGMAVVSGGMVGVIRTMYIGKKSIAKLSPVDFVANATIVSAWKRSLNTNKEEVLYFTCTDAEQNPLPWSKSIELTERFFPKYPLYEKILWYPHLQHTSNYAWHLMSLLLFQLIPAIFFDILKFLSGNKPMFLRLQRKILNSMSILYYFTTHDFQFETKKLQELYSELDDDDKKTFNFDHTTISWSHHHEVGIREIRKYLLKEDPSTIEKAREKLRYYYIANVLVKLFFGTIAIWYTLKAFNVISQK